MAELIWGALGLVAIMVIAGGAAFVSWRMAKGHAKLQESRTVKAHEHVWSPWEPHEAALYDGAELVRYAPGQLRSCLDPSCGAEDIRLIGGQTTSGDNDART